MSERETNEQGFCPNCKSPSYAGHTPGCLINASLDSRESEPIKIPTNEKKQEAEIINSPSKEAQETKIVLNRDPQVSAPNQEADNPTNLLRREDNAKELTELTYKELCDLEKAEHWKFIEEYYDRADDREYSYDIIPKTGYTKSELEKMKSDLPAHKESRRRRAIQDKKYAEEEPERQRKIDEYIKARDEKEAAAIAKYNSLYEKTKRVFWGLLGSGGVVSKASSVDQGKIARRAHGFIAGNPFMFDTFDMIKKRAKNKRIH